MQAIEALPVNDTESWSTCIYNKRKARRHVPTQRQLQDGQSDRCACPLACPPPPQPPPLALATSISSPCRSPPPPLALPPPPPPLCSLTLRPPPPALRALPHSLALLPSSPPPPRARSTVGGPTSFSPRSPSPGDDVRGDHQAQGVDLPAFALRRAAHLRGAKGDQRQHCVPSPGVKITFPSSLGMTS